MVGKDLQDDLVHPSVHPHHAQCPCPSVTHPHGSWTPLPPPWNTVFLTNTVLGWHMSLLWNIQDRWSKTQDTKQWLESKAYCPHHHTTWFVSLYDILWNPRAHISVKLLRQPMLLNFEEVWAEHQLQGLVRIQKKKQIQLLAGGWTWFQEVPFSPYESMIHLLSIPTAYHTWTLFSKVWHELHCVKFLWLFNVWNIHLKFHFYLNVGK